MSAAGLRAIGFVLTILLGYFLKRVRLFGQDAHKTITKTVVNITMPAAVVGSIANANIENKSWFFISLLAFCLDALLLFLGYLFSRKKAPKEKALYMLNFSSYSIGTFTLPYLQNFLGAQGALIACLFDMGNAMMGTGINYPLVSFIIREEERFSIKSALKKLFSSVPFVTFCIMIFTVVCSIHIPESVLTVVGTFASGNAFLAMLMIGLSLDFNIKKSDLKSAVLNLLVRNLVALSASLCVYYFTSFPLLIRQMLVLILFSPCGAMSIVFTEKIAGEEYKARACFVNSMSIIISLIIDSALLYCWRLS